MPIGRFARLRTDVREFLVRRHMTLPPEIRRSDRLHSALSSIAMRWPDAAPRDADTDTEKPIFIFSAGWRSGSTLLQRLVMSDTRSLVWGEPLGDTACIARLAHSLDIIGADWPPDSFFPGGVSANNLSGEWIANLTPTIASLREAHRAFFLAWLRDTAATEYNALRWGLKEVRLTMDHARYFHWLFPQAKFLFICRDPIAAYRSWRGNRWRSPWPGYHPYSAVAFGRHWSRLAEGFFSGHADVGGMLIRYEDLVGGRVDLNGLAAYLEFDRLDPEPLTRRIDAPTDKPRGRKREIGTPSRLILSLVCGRAMRQLGYR